MYSIMTVIPTVCGVERSDQQVQKTRAKNKHFRREILKSTVASFQSFHPLYQFHSYILTLKLTAGMSLKHMILHIDILVLKI